MLPILIREQLVKPFCYYHEGQIHEGMNYRRKLYRLTKTFTDISRSSAYAFGTRLSSQGIDTVITVSDCGCCYKVWVDLSSREDRDLFQPTTVEDRATLGKV